MVPGMYSIGYLIVSQLDLVLILTWHGIQLGLVLS